MILRDDLINYLADNEGEIKDMAIKMFYGHAQQWEELVYQDALTQAYCKCGAELKDWGPLCTMCDADESDNMVHSFHQAWEYPPAHKKGAATLKEWGPFGIGPLRFIAVG